MRSFVFSSGAPLCGNWHVVCLPHAYDHYVAFRFYAVQHLVVPSHVDHSHDARCLVEPSPVARPHDVCCRRESDFSLCIAAQTIASFLVFRNCSYGLCFVEFGNMILYKLERL